MTDRIARNVGFAPAMPAMMDGLERRVMLSGNVTASVVNGALRIDGDASGNSLVLDRAGLAKNQVRVSSGSSATTINGAAGPAIFTAVKGLKIDLKAGDDTLSANGLGLMGGLAIATGDGSNTVELRNLTVGMNLGVGGAGRQTVTLRGVKVAGTTVINATGKPAAIKIDDSTFGRAFAINASPGTDVVQIETSGSPSGSASVFNGTVAIALNGGADSLLIGVKGQTGNRAVFRKGVSLNGGAQRDTLVFSGASSLAGGSVVAFESINPSTPAGIKLRTAAAFAILSGAGVSNTGPSIINGNLGSSPTGTLTGAPTVNGTIHNANPTAAQAKLDLTAAYNEAKGRAGTPTIVLPGELSGLTLAPGVYKNSSTVKLSSGKVTLDARGNPNAVFIFQIGSTLTTLSGTQLILAGGAKAANIYWQVGSSATLGTNSAFKGNIMADQSITLTSGAKLEGRALARIGAVVLDSNIVTVPAA